MHVRPCVLVGHAAPVAGRHHCGAGVAVVRAVGREHLVAAGGEPRHPDRVLVRVGSAVREEHLAEMSAGLLDDALRRLAACEVAERGADRRKLIGLGLDPVDDRWMLVPHVGVDEHAREVEEPVAVVVPDLAAETASDHERIERALRRPRVEHVRTVEVVGELAVGGVEVVERRGRSWCQLTDPHRLTFLFYIARLTLMDDLARVTAPTLDVLEHLLDATDPTWGLLLVKATGRPGGRRPGFPLRGCSSVARALQRVRSAGTIRVAPFAAPATADCPERTVPRVARTTKGGWPANRPPAPQQSAATARPRSARRRSACTRRRRRPRRPRARRAPARCTRSSTPKRPARP